MSDFTIKKFNFLNLFAVCFLIMTNFSLLAQENVGIGTTTPNASAILELDADDKGLLIPRLTTTERDAITAVTSLIIFNETNSQFEYYDGTNWIAIISSGDGLSFDLLTAGTNLGQALLIGDGSTLAPTGTGTITSNIFTGTGSTSNAIDLATAEVNGILPIANGGTNASTFTQDKFLIYNGTRLVSTTYDQNSFLSSTLTSANIFVGNGSNVANGVTMTGDASITNSGALTINDNAITNAKVSGTAEIEVSKLANSPTDNQIIRTNGTTVEWWTPNYLTSYTETDPIWTTASSNYYTKTNVQTSGGATIHWDNITNEPTFLTVTGTNNGDLMYYNGTNWVALAPGTSGQVLRTNGTGSAPDWLTLSNGTVTSVALSMPSSIFTVANSPITTSGSLDVTLGTQNQNLVFASPNGSSGVPTFRALVENDIPNLSAAKITTGILPIARGGTGSTTAPTDGQLLIGNTSTSGFSLATLTAGSNVTITNGNGTIQIAASASGLANGTINNSTLRWDGSVWLESGFLRNTSASLAIGNSVTPTAFIHSDAGDGIAHTHRFTAGTTTSNNGFDIGIDASGNAVIKQNENLNLAVSTNNIERMKFWNDGQIGINYSTSFDDSLRVWLAGDMLIDGDLVVTGNIDPITISMIPQNTQPTAPEGTFYYDNVSKTLKFNNGTTWNELSSGGGGNTLDAAYNQGGDGLGRTITADAGAVVIGNDAANNSLLVLNNTSTTANSFEITTTSNNVTIDKDGNIDAGGDVDIAGNLTVGTGGSKIAKIIKAKYEFTSDLSIPAPDFVKELTVSVTNVEIGSTVFVSPSQNLNTFIAISYAYVSSAGQITIRFASTKDDTQNIVTGTILFITVIK